MPQMLAGETFMMRFVRPMPSQRIRLRDGPYNPRRGDKVIAYSKGLLDKHFPLTSASHTNSIKYSIVTGELSVDTLKGTNRLADPSQFVGHLGDADGPNSIFLSKDNLQIEIVIDPEHPIGSADPANIADVMVKSAVSTIMDCEDSVATVDADDKVLQQLARPNEGHSRNKFHKRN